MLFYNDLEINEQRAFLFIASSISFFLEVLCVMFRWRSTMPLLPTHKKKAGIAEKKPKKILFT
jgi:hypothetical protein